MTGTMLINLLFLSAGFLGVTGVAPQTLLDEVSASTTQHTKQLDLKT